MTVQKSSVKDITFSATKDDQVSVHIPAQLLEQKPKDGIFDGYINFY